MMQKDKKKIFAVFKTHFDYGYTDSKENVLKSYAMEGLEQVLSVCESTQAYGEQLSYKWTVCSFLLMKMYERASEANRERMQTLIRKGQIACHALPFTMHTPLLDTRLMQEMFRWTDEYVQTFEKPFPISAKMTDVPGHTSSIIAPLLKRGVKFLHLGKNGASLAPDLPLLFWWEDLQGNRILTMYNRDYGSSLTPPKGWKYPVWLAFCHTYDNAGVQGTDYVLDIQKQVGKDYDFQTGTLDEFASALLQCDLSDIPVVKGELSDTWIHGVGSYPDAVACFRRAKEEFYRLESLAAARGVDIEKEKKVFFENALVFTEHTFGCNVLKFFKQKRVYDKKKLRSKRKKSAVYAFAERTWEDEKAFAFRMQETCDSLKEKLSAVGEDREVIGEALAFTPTYDDKYIYVDCGNQRAKLYYEYRLFGAESVHTFTKKYLTRFVLWSISDFGKLRYPEIPDRRYLGKIVNVKSEGNVWTFTFAPPKESVQEYGNFSAYRLQLIRTQNGLHIAFKGKGKQANSLVEAGNFIVELERGNTFFVEQAGREVNVDTDIVKNGNQVLWAMDGYARIDDIKLCSYDAPLVSFGENAVCRFNGGKRRKSKPNFVVNVFNNHWGTNFPQWIEGDFAFAFMLTQEK